jgi:hypothetical protein
MMITDPEALNRRLDTAEWLSHAADLRYFEALVGQVRRLERPGDALSIPDVAEPHAWRRTYQIYVALKRRDASTVVTPEFPAQNDEGWNRYVQGRAALVQLAASNQVDDLTLRYVGLKPHDLDDPVPKEGPGVEWGRYPDWGARASRIDLALGKLEGLTPAERAAIPRIMESRRLEAENKELSRRLAALEEAATQKSTREAYENGQ